MVVYVLVISVLLCGALCAATCIGIGAFVGKWFATEADAVEMFWLGLGAVVAILELYHLMRPIDAAIGLALLLVGSIGFITNDLALRLLQEMRRAGPWVSSIYSAAIIVIALRSAKSLQVLRYWALRCAGSSMDGDLPRGAGPCQFARATGLQLVGAAVHGGTSAWSIGTADLSGVRQPSPFNTFGTGDRGSCAARPPGLKFVHRLVCRDSTAPVVIPDIRELGDC